MNLANVHANIVYKNGMTVEKYCFYPHISNYILVPSQFKSLLMCFMKHGRELIKTLDEYFILYFIQFVYLNAFIEFGCGHLFSRPKTEHLNSYFLLIYTHREIKFKICGFRKKYSVTTNFKLYFSVCMINSIIRISKYILIKILTMIKFSLKKVR